MAGLGTGAPIVKLYHEKSMILPDVSRVLACLYEKDIEFKTHHTSSYKGLLRLQASSHVPVPFYDGLTFLEDSREICRYVAETYEHRGDPFLLGKDSLERASIEQWLHHEEHAFNPPSRSLFCHLAFPLTEEDDDIDLQKIKLEEVLEVYEQRLGDTEYLAGNKFTLADLVHLPNSHYITESDKFAYLYDSRKNVQRWWNAISTRKSWQNVLKDIQVVEQQRKQEEFEKQQQRQWRREHPPTTRRPMRLDSRKQTSTKSQTILVPPPVGIISTSPTASQAEKPLPTETSPDETLLSTTQSKHTTIFTTHQETPPDSVQNTPRLPGYPHIPVQSTSNSFTPATSPTTVENLSRTGADIPDNQYSDHTPERPAETIYGGSTYQKVTYTSPGKHGSAEAHQKLQTEQWHGTAAGLSNLKGETDYLVPTQQVKLGKDVQHSSSQDSEQISTHPLAQEPVSMDRQLVQGPEMAPRTPYSDQKRDVSSMPWRQAADVRGIAEEDKASSDHRDAVPPPYARKHADEAKIVSADHRNDASPPKRVKDEDTQAIPFQTAYDDAHDITQEARETAPAPRQRAQDAYDTPEAIETYHSSSSRAQPIKFPQDAAPPPKKEASEGRRRVTAPYPAAQEFIKLENPAPRSTVPRDAQDNTEDELLESSSSKAHLLDSRLADARPPKKYLDEDGYGEIVPLQTGSADDPYYSKRDRDTAAPKRMMPQDAFEETKMSDSASFEAQTFDHRQADASPQKQRLDGDPQTAVSPPKKRYSGGEDTTEQSKTSASRPRRMAAQEIQDNFEETKAVDSRSTRERPSDSSRAPPPLPRHEADDVRSRTSPSQKRDPYADADAGIKDRRGATSPLERRYAHAEDTTKHSGDTAFKRSKIVGQDVEDTVEAAEAGKSALFRDQPQDARRVATTPSKQAAEESRSSPKRHPRAEETSKQPRAAASKPTHTSAQDRDVIRESKVADSTSSIEQPSDARAAASFQKQEVPDARNTSSSFQKRYPDVTGATKKSKVTFEETKGPDSASSRVQPLDSQRDYAPSWKKEATEAPRATTPFKKRDSDVEDTAKHPDGAFKPRQIVGQDTQGTYEEAKASDSGLPREQSSDTWQAATTPTEKVAIEDGHRGTPPSERNAPNDEHTTMRPRGAASAPRQTTAGDASGAFRESKPADSVSSREQPLRAQKPVVTPRQETEDSLSKISAFHKTRPFVEDNTRQAVDTVFGPRQIGAEDSKDITEETKVADSSSSVRARPTYTPRTARPLSEQAEVEEDPRDKDREGRESISAPKKMVSRDAKDTYGERKIPQSASIDQSLDNLQASSPLKQTAAEDPRGASRGAKESLVDEPKESQGVKGVSKKSAGTFEETKDPTSALPTAQPLSAQDDPRTDRSSRTPTADQWKDASTQPRSNNQDTYKEARSSSAHQKGLGSSPSQAKAGDEDQAIISEKVFSSEQLRKMPKESRSASSKAQPADSRSPIKVERTPSVYQEDHLVAPDNREQPQILTTGVREDGSTPKRQQAPVVPSTSEEKSTPPTPPRAKVHDNQLPFKRDTVDDPKGAPLLSGREPTSQVQHATELTPDRDMSSKPSNIDQWRLTSAPAQGITANSGDDLLGVSTIDQKPTPMSQQTIPGARGANEMVKREQRRETSAPAGAQTPDVQHAPPSFAGPDITERDGEPVQMQEQTLHARPTSVPTRRATPDARDTGDNEFLNASDAQRWKDLKAKHDSAMIDEEDRDASLSTHDKTTRHASEAQLSDTLPSSTAAPVNVRPTSGDELVGRFSRDQGARPPESTQAHTPFDAPRDSLSTQGVPSDSLGKTKFAKPSSTEGMIPTARPASALEAQRAEHKAPSVKKLARAARPLSSGESRKEDTSLSAADQTKKPKTIFRQQARPSKPITEQLPSYEQVARAPQTSPSERDMTPAPGTSDSPASNTQIASAKFQEAFPDSYRPDKLTAPFVSSEKQGSYSEPHKGPSHDAHGAADDKGITKYPSGQAPVLEYRPDLPVRPTSGDEPGISPDQGAESSTAVRATNSEDPRNEVFPAEKKSASSDQDSVHSVQQPSPAESRRGKTIVAAAQQTLPTNIGQQHRQDMSEAPTSDFVPGEDIPSDAGSGRPDEVPLVEQKLTSSDQDAQLSPSVEPRNEQIRSSTRSAQPFFSAPDDQTKFPQKTSIGQQDVAPTPGTSKSPSSDTHHASGQLQEVAPDDHHTVESLPSQGQVSRSKPSFVASEGPTRDSLYIDKKNTKLPSSQAKNSGPKPDSTQNRSDEPSTRFLANQLSKQPAETQAQPPLVGPRESKSNQDITSDTLGKPKSLKPSSIDQEATGSALTPDTYLGSAPGQVALAGQKLPLKDQDSAYPTQKSSLSEPTKEQSTVTAPNEAKTSPTIFSQQDKALAQNKMKDPSSGSQYVPQRLQEITPEDQRITGSIPMQQEVPHFEHISKPHDGPTPDPNGAFVEEPMADTTDSTPNAQYGIVPSRLSPDEGHPEISDKDSDHHTHLRSFAGSRKEEGDVDPSDQTIMPAPDTSESSGEVLEVGPGNQRSSELNRPFLPSRKQDSHAGHPESHEGPNPDAERAVADEKKPPPVVSQARSLEAVSYSAPSRDDVNPSEPVAGLTNEHEKQTPAAFQASLPPEALYDSNKAKSMSTDAFGEVGPLKATGEVTPADQSIATSEPLPIVESVKKSTGAEAEESKVYQPVTGQKDIRHAPGISEHVLDDDHNKEPVSRKEQVSDDQRAYEPREGSPDVHGASLDKKTTPPSSRAQGSDPKRDSIPKSVDVNPSMTSPAPAPEAQQDQDLTISSQPSPSVVARKDVADQTNVSQAGPREPASSDSTRPSEKMQEFSPDAYLTKSEKTLLPIKGADPVQPSYETPLDLSTDEKTTMIKGDQANTVSNVSLSASQPVGLSENSAVKRPLSEESMPSFSQKNLERTSPEEKSKQQQQIDQSSTRSSKDESIKASGIASPNMLTTSGDIQPSPPKESMQAAQGSRNQQQANQAVFQSIQDNEKKIEETEAQDNGSYEPKKIRPDSAPITGDARRTSDDGPATSSLRDSRAQPPAGTLNAPAVFLEKESPRPPSADQAPMTSKTSPAPAPAALQDKDSTQSPQLSPAVVSTNVPQAGLREPASLNATRPSEEIQEFSPDASLTNSAKPLLPMTEPLPVVKSRKESTGGAEAEESKVYQPVTGQKDIRHATGISEHVLDDDHNKEPVSREEQVSDDQRAAEPREGSPPDVHGASLDKKTTPTFDQTQSSDSKRDSLPKSVDVDPSSGRQSTKRLLRGEGAQLHSLTRSPPLHESRLYAESNEDVPESSANQEATSPKVVPASAPDTILGTTSDEIAPDRQNIPLSARDLARSGPQPFSIDPTKEKGIVASSDQTNELQTIIGQRVTPIDKEKTPFDLQTSELAKPPNENQDQVHAGSAYEEREGPAPDAGGAVDEKTPASTDQELRTPMNIPTLAPEVPQDQDLTTTSQLPPSVVSRKDIADQANVSQASLREPASSESTLPSEKIQKFSPDGYLSKSEKLLLPMKGTDPVQPPYEASLDLSSDEKTTMIKGDQANKVSNISLSASQPVGQSENSSVKRPLSEDSVSLFSSKNLERTLPEEKPKQQQQQTDQSSTRSSRDDSIEASELTVPNILKASADMQPLPPKESMQAAQRSRNQQQAGQAVFQSMQDKEKQIEETEAKDNGSYEPKNIRPDSAPITGYARRTSDDGPATSSIPAPVQDAPQGTTPLEAATDSQKLSPSAISRKAVANADQTNVSQAGLRETASSDVTRPSEKIPKFSPDAYLAKSVKPLLPMEGTDPVQTTREASFDMSSNEKPTMIKGEQTNTISNVSLSTSQPVGQSENSADKGPLSKDFVSPLSQTNLEKTSPEEKSQQQQTNQSSTRSSVEANRTTDPDISTTSGDIQPSPLKESTQAAKGSGDQTQADQAVSESTLDDEKQFEETEARVIGPDELYETNLLQNTSQKKDGSSQGDALEQPDELVPAVQPRRNDTNIGSKPTVDAPGSVQLADKKPGSSLRTSEESEQQVLTEGKIQGGETKAPASDAKQPEQRDLQSSNKGIASQSQAETPSKLQEQTSSGTQSSDTNSSKLYGPPDDMKPADRDDNPPSS